MAQQPQYTKFFFQLADLGMILHYPPLVENTLSILKIMPADQKTVETVSQFCKIAVESGDDNFAQFDTLFFAPSPTQVVYNLGVIHSLLMPAQNPMSDEAHAFQFDFMKSGCGCKILELLTKNNFLSRADDFTKM